MFTRGTRRFYRVIEESKLCRVHRVVERFIFVEYNVYTIRLRGQLTLLPTRARFSRDCSVLAQQTSNNDRPKIVGVIERRLLYDGRVKKYNNRYNVDKKKQEISLTQLLRNYHLIQEAIVSHQDQVAETYYPKLWRFYGRKTRVWQDVTEGWRWLRVSESMSSVAVARHRRNTYLHVLRRQ